MFKKFTIGCGGVFLILLLICGGLAWKIVGPSKPLVISPETTFITEPLTPEGYVDYPAALLDELREGVTPENNGAIVYLQATWPSRLDEPQQAIVCNELGMEIPTRNGFMLLEESPQAEEIQAWLEDGGDLVFEDSKAVLRSASQAPWRREDCPPLAVWLDSQKEDLDRLAELENYSHFYLPSDEFFTDPDALLLEHQLIFGKQARDIARALSARAMLAISESRPDDAARDVQTLFVLSRVLSPEDYLIHHLVEIAIRRMAIAATYALLASGQCDVRLLEEMVKYQDAHPEDRTFLVSINQSERYAGLQVAQMLANGCDPADLTEPLYIEEEGAKRLLQIPFDRNVMMRQLNSHYDSLATALALDTLAQRADAIAACDEQFQIAVGKIRDPEVLSRALIEQSDRGRLVGDVLAAMLVIMNTMPLRTEVETNLRLRLLRISIVLEQYRLEHDEYPETLQALTDKLDQAKLKDPFSDGPYRYDRRGAGYLLYSLHIDREDDGGDDPILNIYGGEFVESGPLAYEQGDVTALLPLAPSKFLQLDEE